MSKIQQPSNQIKSAIHRDRWYKLLTNFLQTYQRIYRAAEERREAFWSEYILSLFCRYSFSFQGVDRVLQEQSPGVENGGVGLQKPQG